MVDDRRQVKFSNEPTPEESPGSPLRGIVVAIPFGLLAWAVPVFTVTRYGAAKGVPAAAGVLLTVTLIGSMWFAYLDHRYRRK